MGEMVVGFGFEAGARSSVSMETTCGALLRELEMIWKEIGESEEDKDRMLLELEMECMRAYRRRVDEASDERAQLHRSLVAKEAELAALVASLGENGLHLKMQKAHMSLKEQLASVTPLLEDLRVKKEERIKQFSEVRSQIDKISAEISGQNLQYSSYADELDLSIRKLDEYQTQLQNLQKEKSDRLHKVLEYVNEVHSLCGVLGVDFAETVNNVHPSLNERDSEKSTNISDSTLEGLSQEVSKLKAEKKIRLHKLREAAKSLQELWNLMDSSDEERRRFEKAERIQGFSEEDVVGDSILSLETIEQSEAEVERLTKLKSGRMKELVLKRRSELEDICANAHIEPDTSTAPEKTVALIDSGLVDPSELLASIEAQIAKAKEESLARKEIMDRVAKWLAACDEENWLEEYNQDQNRYSAGRGAHLNLKRAEKARVLVGKIPAIVDNLMIKTFAWEDERNMPFQYDGVRLVAVLEEYKLTRLQKEEERRRHRDQKKLQNLWLTEKELTYGSKPSPRRKTNGYHSKGAGNGFMTPMPRRISAGGATPELLTPRSHSSLYNSYFREARRLSAVPLNFVAVQKDDSMSSFASISGSEAGSPYRHYT
ncbi:65-kDa microtubule-associated protein 7 [Ananas comosus]|uniref:65-kDa microtubule-associated protein 7 n=1 Tax=Ananas comosus TaxID=4615 RepID=A0A6P5G874_ANACO|nr:65-kDa microtubule-associated protein 7 [Ananas comosus]XP_020104805.1 65-kDa microtubule-associated protein 7 [Ananas comosus]XP_020104806.1 65-kDa microtubule-associated protein 7 [Ananas comosus]XP_020104807.1 65-kDa microtubule-associated protein 7 [Ananas comosus]